jgi:hypothetical protein
VCLDPDKVNEVNDPLRVNRTRERRYAFDHVFGGTSDTVDLHTTMACAALYKVGPQLSDLREAHGA